MFDLRTMFWRRQPSPALAPYVEALWYCEGYAAPHRKERVLPSGRFQLVIELADVIADALDRISPALVVGMQSQYGVIDTAGLQSVIGAVFRPGGALAFFDLHAEEFYNRSVPLDLVWGTWASRLRERLQEAVSPDQKLDVLDAGLRRRVQSRHGLHAAVRHALGEFGRAPHIQKVLDVAREAGVSRRYFAQLFREQVGLTPKMYCRVRRFQQVLGRIASGAPVDWADVALACGYSDQAHLSHEFRDFSGISPGAYLASDRPYQNHVPIE
jgi:AraC-like DNA-binding protein